MAAENSPITSLIRAYAPASIGNLAAGFDCLGAALAPVDGSLLGDIVELLPAKGTIDSLETLGPFAFQLEGKENLVLRTSRLFREALALRGWSLPPMAFRLFKNLPVNSGLGSSGSSIVAALVALQAAAQNPFSQSELLHLAGQAEGIFSGAVHLDNVGPTLSGGLQLVTPVDHESKRQSCRPLPWLEGLRVIVVHPHCEVPTALARRVLPAAYPLNDVVAWGQNLAALVHALHAGDRQLFGHGLRDLLVEPHRARLVPGFSEAKAAALAAGALGCSFSGSGPSTFAVVDRECHPDKLRDAMVESFRQAGLACHAWICDLDFQGARLIQ